MELGIPSNLHNRNDLYYGHGPWQFHVQNINELPNHTNLYKTDSIFNKYINVDVVQLPIYISEASYPDCKHRWTLIKESLLEPILTSKQLEDAIKKYNKIEQEFLALHYFLNEFLGKAERDQFFVHTLPGIINLAFRLPELLHHDIPILKQKISSSMSFNQLQIASLLANAFLCTFPGKSSLCPVINFNWLFASHARVKRIRCVSEKLKTICHYFERTISKDLTGVITFERRSLDENDLPAWETITNRLGKTKVYVSSTGLIEDDADGFLQVDFANRNVGGGVLAYGCVQEEIRFVICPELLVSRLFTQQLGPTEALIITGAERYSSYIGYGDSYEWKDDYVDSTPCDIYGRRRTTIVAIDAIRFAKPAEQYKTINVQRELNKAYAGFQSSFQEQLPAVATGNWGCGAYKGDPKLKFLIQLMACNVSKRDLIYFTFNSEKLSEELIKMYKFITENNFTIDQLWKYLRWFSFTKLKPDYLYRFICYIHLHNEFYKEEDFSKFSVKTLEKTVSKKTEKQSLGRDDTKEDYLCAVSSFF